MKKVFELARNYLKHAEMKSLWTADLKGYSVKMRK